MIRAIRLTVLIFFGCMLAFSPASAQRHRFVPVEDRVYNDIRRLQLRGHLRDLNPTALPYREREIAEALSGLNLQDLSNEGRVWARRLITRFRFNPVRSNEVAAGVETAFGASAVNSERRDVLRPIDHRLRGFEHILLRAYLEKGPLIAHFGARHDLYYDRDPDGISPVNRLKARPEDDYIGYDGALASLYLGRFANHWGVYDAPATVVSANPRAYDQLNFRLGGKRLSLRSLLGELDSITADGRFTGIAGDDSVRAGSERRYVAAHRIDWRPNPGIVLTLMESAVYSGSNSGLSLKYLNPFSLAILTVDNRPKNDENNGLIGGSVWIQIRRTTFFGQLMFDDFDILNRQEPASFALVGNISNAAAHNLDLDAGIEIVAARTYNTGQPEGKYLYLDRGLATQFSDYVHASTSAHWYLDRTLPGLTLSPQVEYLAQGESDIRAPFPPKESTIPTLLYGTIERTVRGSVRLEYQADSRWWIAADLGLNHVSNEHAIAGRSSTRIVGQVEFGIRLALDRAINLDF